MAALRAARRQQTVIWPQDNAVASPVAQSLNRDEDSESETEDSGSRRPSQGRSQFSTNDSEAIEDERIRLTPFNEIDHFEEASRAINGWLAEWGGLESWPRFLDVGYEAARKSGSVDLWVSSALDHADRGRLLEKMLGQMETTLPEEMWKIRELWRRQTVLVGLVVKALTLIEVRVDVIQHGPFNLLHQG
ncbi:hypothetical protein BDN72DRAFT_546318 [Pluteus cervinus]|uniref:Uncharacterized protein n=1 Tax=Pluteus cervinus TaxID=181527 RepID=A0ACD3A366_9AGAR|nr:hypothetical protein BDN72DRAFT_546318 [Pluteus cervinus]